MARLRPARCYRRIRRPYTRKSKYREKHFIRGGVPHIRIRKFVTGNIKGKFTHVLYLVSQSDVQVRDNALEAARVSANRILEKRLGKMNYLLIVRKYPHHVLRWNPLASMAGADRFQKGMRKAYGKPIGIAAQVFKGDEVIEVRVNEEGIKLAKYALKIASIKMPGNYKIIIKQVQS